MSGTIDFAACIGPVARRLLGEPNQKLSTREQLRFGTHGSVAVELGGEKRGTWFDHEANEGGGVIDLLRRQKRFTKGEALEWLRQEIGLHIPDEEIRATTSPRIVATYDYFTADGDLAYQVVRMEPKTFRQRKPDGHGGWDWKVKGTTMVPYRLPELITSTGTVFIAEGEKDVDRLRSIGLTATCNPGGAGKWPASLNPYFRGRHVVILPDNDHAGREHAEIVTKALSGTAKTIRTLDLPDLPAKGDVSDWLDAGGTAEALHAMLKGPTPDEAEPLPLVMFEDIQPSLDANDFVQGVLTEGGASMVYGESNAGKTFWATNLSLHVAAGMEWCGRRVEQGGVVYAVLEGGIGFRNRVHVWKVHHGMEDARIPFASIPAGLNLLNPEADTPKLILAIRKAAEAFGMPVKLIVIDTLARAFAGGNENASEDMGALVRNMDQIREATGANVLFIHHSGKDQAKGARGHSSLRAAIDTEIEVTAPKDGQPHMATIVKQREMPKGAEFPFSLDVVALGTNRHGEAVTSCVVVPAEANEGERTGELIRSVKLNSTSKIGFEALQNLMAEKGASGFQGVPDGVLSIPTDWWRDRFYRVFPHDSQDAKRMAFLRVKTDLVSKHIARIEGGRSWLI